MHRIHLYNNLERRKDISVPVYQCLCDRWKRGDTAKLLARETGRSVHEVKQIVADHQTHLLFDGVERIIDRMHRNILNQDLSSLPAIIYHEKEDPSSHKMRTIGVESIEQQLYDEVADYALQPLKKRIGTYQIACLKGKGGAMGNRALRRWMRDKRVRWAVQADVKKCYESIDRKKLMDFLRHVVKGSPRVFLNKAREHFFYCVARCPYLFSSWKTYFESMLRRHIVFSPLHRFEKREYKVIKVRHGHEHLKRFHSGLLCNHL